MMNFRQPFTGMRFSALALVAAMIATFAIGGAIAAPINREQGGR